MNKTKETSLTIYVKEEIKEKLKIKAKELNISLSDLVNSILEIYLNNK